ncbi:MAG: TonB-dependent receptor [Bacteroidetes bacterium]|nr:TonB-dependent receptor [Bacteroidota bacterium]
MQKFKTYILVLFLFPLLAIAQMPGGGMPGGGGKMKMPAIGRVYGKVIDAKTKQAVEFASVALFNAKDSAIAGSLTKQNGDFSLDNLPFGAFTLRIRFIGYKAFEQKVMINPQNLEKDLGNIKIEPDAALLNEVEISADKGNMSMSIDRKVYNVDKDLSVTGGTGLDALKNIPSVNVDADGAVTLRNSSVQIFVDGRPTTLTMQQIPADQIERIEVITNPSVKFDANTTGGILNVVMKKNTKPGYNGTIQAGIGTNDRYNGMANLNIKEKPFNFSLTYSYNSSRNVNKGFTNRTNISNPTPVKYFDQQNLTYMSHSMNMARFSVDYTINNRNTITLGGNFTKGLHITSDFQDYKSLDTSNAIVSNGWRLNKNNGYFDNYTATFNYRKTFPKPQKEFTIDLSYNRGKTTGGYNFTTYDYSEGVSYLGPQIEINDADGNSNLFTFQSDFSNPINDSTKIEIGIKSTYKQSRNTNVTSDYSYVTNDYAYDSILSNDYLIDDLVNGLYINYITRVRKINIQAGLRFEQSYYKGNVLNKPNQDFSYSYPSSSDILKSIFPGIYFSRKFSESSEAQLNFSRKINRPIFQLMPFVMFADRYNYRIGNPSLAPEFVNMAEMNYNFVKKNLNYLTSVYGKYTEGVITNVAYPSAADPTVLVNTFMNGDNSFSYGWENTMKLTLLKNLNITANITTYYLNIKYSTGTGATLQNDGYSWESKMTLAYKFPLDITFQVNGGYDAPKPLAQGSTLEMYYMDLSLNKSFKQRLTFNLSLNDVFNTKRRGTHYDTPDYIQDLSRRRESRFLKFSVTWMFGKPDASLFKRKNSGKQNRSGESSEGMDF